MNKYLIVVFLSLWCVGIQSKATEGAKDGLVGIYKKTPKLNTVNANPLLDLVYCADPTAIVHDGRVYVYGSNDQQQCDSVGTEVKDNFYEYIHSLVMISSDDMVNWTYHGAIDVEKAAPWTGKKGVSWAPSIVSRLEADGKTHFYLYYAHGGGGVAMLTSTSPVGPWTDPLGHDIVYFGMPGLEDCPAPFDPGVVIDEHGQGWLSFGGGIASYGTDYMPGSARIVRLADDMMSVAGDIVEIPAPYFFEASELNYINGTYIYSYSTNWLERNEWPYSTIKKPTTCCIGYMTSKTPLIKESWEYRGNILKNPGEYDGMSWANNHTHFLKFKDSYYMFYHNRILEESRGIKPGFRSICVDKIDLDEVSSTISLGTMTRTGPAQIKKVNPFEWQSAATTAATYGIKYIEGAEPGKMILRADGSGQCFEVRGVDCANSSRTVEFRVKGKGEITIRKNGTDGEEVAIVRFESNDWKVISTNLTSTLTGNLDLFFVFGKGEVLLDEWKFSPEEKKIFSNPVIFADVPDVDVIRVDDNFYMISTTMHLMPGAPIMRSKDLVNWEIISYLYDEIKDSPFYDLEEGHAYSAGQWASSLRYHNGKFYVFFATNNPSKSYIYTATNPAGKWEKLSVLNQFHDASLLFDDDGRVYLAHSAGNIKITELKSDLSGVKENGLDITAIHGEQHGYKGLLEGTHIYKFNGKYYMLLIWWPKDGIRTQLCFRSDQIEGPYESKIILSDTIDNPGRGVAQGAIVDTSGGQWYGFLFQDFGAVGRTPVLMPCRWEDGWPMLGDENGKVKKWLEKPIQGYPEKPLVISDDFTSTKLALNWQWNHNPDNNLWSLTARAGYLRLRTGKVVQNIFEARNTLSQRTEGPQCSGIISIDISHMKDGDITGLGAYNGEPGLISVVKEKKKKYLVMTDRGREMERVELKKNNVHLRMDCDFNINVDKARFYYSLDGKEWMQLGPVFQMNYYTSHFMGIRFAIYNYATKHSGGYVDVDSFAYDKEPLQQTPLKPRLVVLTDIAPGDIEPDDMESMIRLLVHADQYEIEALIASSGWNSNGRPYPASWIDSLKTTINAYEKDLPNLMKRSGQTGLLPLDRECGQHKTGYWPSADYLRSRSMLGSLNMGYTKLGDENRSAGSDFIIKLADEADERPLWITVWGGGNTLAQAIWQVKQERTEEQLKAFLNKLRVYTITDQDVPWRDRHTNYPFSSHHWMRHEFGKDLLFICDESAWLSQNDLGAKSWKEYATHIQNHGNLGAIYPKNKWGVEGDTPSFLHVMPNGLNNPTMPNHTGWGGYFEWSLGMDNETYCYTNHSTPAKEISRKYEKYFYPATFNNFAARMDWASEGKGNRNPIVIVNGEKGIGILNLRPKQGSEVILDGSRSFDPDADQITFKWWVLPEAGTFPGTVTIMDANTEKSKIKIPQDAAGKNIHVICEVTDMGSPSLTSYRRIIFEVSK